MFIAAFSTIAKNWKQPKCPLTDEWVTKMWYVRSMQHYVDLQGEETLTHVTAWIKLQGCYNLIVSSPDSYVEALTPNVTVCRHRAFRQVIKGN